MIIIDQVKLGFGIDKTCRSSGKDMARIDYIAYPAGAVAFCCCKFGRLKNLQVRDVCMYQYFKYVQIYPFLELLSQKLFPFLKNILILKSLFLKYIFCVTNIRQGSDIYVKYS